MTTSKFKPIKINEQICKSCDNAILNENVPTFAWPLYIKQNEKLMSLVQLTYLEERLVAPRMDFSQTRQLGYKISQIGLTGTIINVPSSLDRI